MDAMAAGTVSNSTDRFTGDRTITARLETGGGVLPTVDFTATVAPDETMLPSIMFRWDESPEASAIFGWQADEGDVEPAPLYGVDWLLDGIPTPMDPPYYLRSGSEIFGKASPSMHLVLSSDSLAKLREASSVEYRILGTELALSSPALETFRTASAPLCHLETADEKVLADHAAEESARLVLVIGALLIIGLILFAALR